MKISFIKWHNALIWFGLTTIIIWAVSGISHPLMAWFGPQAVKMFPPSLSITDQDALAVQQVIKQHQLSNATIAKIVPTADGPMLQLTETEQDDTPIKRRYFSLSDQQAVADYDQQQAAWLAAYYAGREVNDVRAITQVTEFSTQYPAVNRLLPVYRIELAGDDGLTVFVHTETNALASINNNTKRTMLSFFQALHTWQFLDFAGFGRVLLIALLMLTLVAMASTGLMLVISIARRKINAPARRWHRSLAYALWLPMLAWPASGFYHLLQGHFVESVAGIRLSESVDLQQWLVKTTTEAQWQHNFATAVGNKPTVNAVSLVKDNAQHYYRLSVANNRNEALSRQARFDGQTVETKVMYINSETGKLSQHTDKTQAITLLYQLIGANNHHKEIELVTRFGSGYDFRNKRLPFWIRLRFS